MRVVSRSPDKIGTSNQVHRNSRNHAHLVNYVRKFDGFSRKRENSAPSIFANYLGTYSRCGGKPLPKAIWSGQVGQNRPFLERFGPNYRNVRDLCIISYAKASFLMYIE